MNKINSLHFVGVGGIGMSALAQMSAILGLETTGSDRGAGDPANRRIMSALRRTGVGIYPQDGSRFSGTSLPDALVYSTAIEEDNPDFKAAGNIRRIHRSEASKLLVDRASLDIMAVAGTCGKTTVTAWLAETLKKLGVSPWMIGGGLAGGFTEDGMAGNFWKGSGKLCVMESDESDKSLLNYNPKYAVVLNIGTDHYSREELARVFREFLAKTTDGAVLSDEVLAEVGPECLAGKKVILFSGRADAPEMIQGFPVVRTANYKASPEGVFADVAGNTVRLPSPGFHQALNAAAIFALLKLLDFAPQQITEALSAFSGVWRRFEFAGKNRNGFRVYDDYAHNVQKISSCIQGAKEICTGRCVFVFQPHGFAPLRFMREELFPELERVLGTNDSFIFLPVYYAGGTASFKPTAEEVAQEYQQKHAGRYLYFADRSAVEKYLAENTTPDDLVVVMGARDNSLSDWAKMIGGNVK